MKAPKRIVTMDPLPRSPIGEALKREVHRILPEQGVV